MNKAGRVGVLGDLGSIIGFRGMAMETFPVSSADESREELERLLRGEDFAVIFVTEQVMRDAADLIKKQQSQPLPAIVSIPKAGEYAGLGKMAISEAVKKAIGFNILGDWDQRYNEDNKR